MVRAVVTIALLLFVTGCYTDGIEDTNYSAPPSNSEFQQMLIDVHDDCALINITFSGSDYIASGLNLPEGDSNRMDGTMLHPYNVTEDITFPIIGEHGSVITCMSSNPGAISLVKHNDLGHYTGVITRQGSDTVVVITIISNQYGLGANWQHCFKVKAL